MTETLQEFFDSRDTPLRVDRRASVIRGVKILGLKSRNGRDYLPEALQSAARLYEETKVNVNHPRGNPAGPRDYQDRIGVIRSVAFRQDEGLYADFHFNPKHRLAEQLLWDAEHAPQNVGFSHNVQARTARRSDRTAVEAILKVQSVDLVADPATTGGLFETQDDPVAGGSNESTKSTESSNSTPALEDLRRDHPQLVEALVEEQSAEIERLQAEIQKLSAAEATSRKQAAIRRLLDEFHLPDPVSGDPRAKVIVGDRFLESLLAAPDEKAMRALIEDRATLVRVLTAAEPANGTGMPRSRAQYVVDDAVPPDSKAFAAAIT